MTNRFGWLCFKLHEWWFLPNDMFI